jgi:hypothetical protein
MDISNMKPAEKDMSLRDIMRQIVEGIVKNTDDPKTKALGRVTLLHDDICKEVAGITEFVLCLDDPMKTAQAVAEYLTLVLAGLQQFRKDNNLYEEESEDE